MVVDELVGIVPAIVHAVAEHQEIAVGGIAQRFCPAHARGHGVAPGVVGGMLVIEINGVVAQLIHQLVEAVERQRALALPNIAETIVGHHRERAPATRREIVVIDQAASEFPAAPVSFRGVVGAVDGRPRGIAGKQRVDAQLPRVVLVERECGTEVESVERVGLPLDAEVGTHVVAAVVGISCRVIPRGGIGEKVLAVAAGAGVAVGVAVHHVAAHAENLLFADIEIHAEALRGVDAPVAAEATEAVAVAIGESKVVGIVGRTDKGQLIVVPEAVYVESGLIAVVGAVTGLHGAEPAILHARFHGEVDHSLILAVVNAGETRQIALAVDHLQLVDHVHRQIFRRHLRVVGEKLFAIHQNFGHGLAVGRDLAVGIDFHARQALEQILDHGVGLCLVAVGIELHRVGHHLYRSLDAHGGHLAETYRRVAQPQSVGTEIGIGHPDRHISLLITHIR